MYRDDSMRWNMGLLGPLELNRKPQIVTPQRWGVIPSTWQHCSEIKWVPITVESVLGISCNATVSGGIGVINSAESSASKGLTLIIEEASHFVAGTGLMDIAVARRNPIFSDIFNMLPSQGL